MTVPLARCALLAGALAGCSTGYAPPPSAAASVHFVNNTPLPMALHLYDEASECKGRHVLKALRPQEDREVLVQGGKDVAFAIVHDVKLDYTPYERLATGCMATLSFKPVVDGRYVFRMDSDGYRCVYQFNEASKSKEEQPAPVAFIKREPARATSEAGPFCRR